MSKPRTAEELAKWQREWNEGARWADAHWADTPVQRYQDERSTDGRSIYADHFVKPASERTPE